MNPRPLLLTLLLTAALALAACGDDEAKTDPSTAAPSGGTPTTPAPAAPAETTTEAEPPPAKGGDPKDLKKKPRVDIPKGDPPAKLVTEDIVKGKGRAAKKGDSIDMKYVGVLFDGGTQFDASWDQNDGRTFPFKLGAGDVIKGWDEGIVGMRKGGRRKLVIPPDLAYGAEGRPPQIPPNSTLVFVVDLTGFR